MTCSSDDHLKQLVVQTKSLLESIGGTEVLREELGYYEPSRLRTQFPTMSHIHVRLSDSVRNTARMRLVITDDRFEVIANQLISHTLASICGGGLDLVTGIAEASCRVSENEQKEKKSWITFKQGVVDAACYLKRFRGPTEFYGYVDSNADTVDRAWSLALELDSIKGIGPTLACDFLKEIGVDRYGKPDVHIKRIFSRLKLIGKNNQDREAFGVIWQISRLTSYSPAVIDKILWMAASGRWDRTLDKQLDRVARKKQQMWRKERFSSLMDNFLQGI